MRRAFVSAMSAAVLLASLGGAEVGFLIQPSDIVYLGAFRLPDAESPDYGTWSYSNAPMAYYPTGDPRGAVDGFSGSLFIAGHVYRSKVAEVDIPTPVISRTLSDLPTARFLQPMTDITATILQKNGFIMGMSYLESQRRIYFTHGSDYSDGDCNPSDAPPGLGSFRPTLSAPDTDGLWYVGRNGTTLHPFTSLRYIMEVPQAWADRYLNGQSLATGRHRGWCPEGTNMYASAPWTTKLSAGGVIPVRPLMEFGSYDETARWSKEHSSSNAYQGGAWLTAGARAAVVISGLVDYDRDRAYYGYENWKRSTECDPNPPASGCTGSRGHRAGDPRPTLLFFDPKDLAAVANGDKKSWTVEWYAKLDLNPYMFRRYRPAMITTDEAAETLLTTYDRARGLLYVSETFVQEQKPVVHVFRVQPIDRVPAAPTNVRIVR